MEKIKNLLSGSLSNRVYDYLQKQGYKPVAVRVQDGSYVNLGHLRKEEAGTTLIIQKDSYNKATLFLEFDDLLPGEEKGQKFSFVVNSLEEVKAIV